MEDMFIISQNNPWDWYTHLHVWLIFKVNVGKYTIHGSYGFVYYLFMLDVCPCRCFRSSAKVFV